MNLSIKRGVLVGAKWISFCACLVISFLALGMAFLIPGDSVPERVWHTGVFVVLLGLTGVGSGYLFRATEIKQLDMSAGESMNFYKNAVVYYARSGDASKFLERTNAISRFVAGLTGPDKMELRPVVLPEPFADLNDCAQEWAISDDTKRAEALEKASLEDLKSLVGVDPTLLSPGAI